MPAGTSIAPAGFFLAADKADCPQYFSHRRWSGPWGVVIFPAGPARQVACTASLLAFGPLHREKFGQDAAAFERKDAANNFGAVIESRIVANRK